MGILADAHKRMAAVKSHLLLSPDPLSFDHPLLCLCGIRVMRPRPEVMWDLSVRHFWPEFNSLRDCPLCVRIAERDARPGQIYLYVVSEAPEAEAEQYSGRCIESLEEVVGKVAG